MEKQNELLNLFKLSGLCKQFYCMERQVLILDCTYIIFKQG